MSIEGFNSKANFNKNNYIKKYKNNNIKALNNILLNAAISNLNLDKVIILLLIKKSK